MPAEQCWSAANQCAEGTGAPLDRRTGLTVLRRFGERLLGQRNSGTEKCHNPAGHPRCNREAADLCSRRSKQSPQPPPPPRQQPPPPPPPPPPRSRPGRQFPNAPGSGLGFGICLVRAVAPVHVAMHTCCAWWLVGLFEVRRDESDKRRSGIGNSRPCYTAHAFILRVRSTRGAASENQKPGFFGQILDLQKSC